MPTTIESITEFQADVAILHNIVHGAPGTTVTTESGDVDTLATAIALVEANAIVPFNGLLQSKQTTDMYDLFDRADGPIDGTPIQVGGTNWSVGGTPANAVVQSGRLINVGGGDGNFYAGFDYGAAVKSGATSFVLFPPPGGSYSRATVACAIILAATSALLNMLHCQISPTAWDVDKRVGGGGLVSIGGGPLNLLVDNGTEYFYELEPDAAGGKLTVRPPDGSAPVIISDADITTIDPHSVLLQTHTAAGGAYCAFTSVSAGKSIARSFGARGGSAPMGAVTRLQGVGFTAKDVFTGTIAAGAAAGFVRILTGNVNLVSKVTIEANNNGGKQLWEFRASVGSTGDPQFEQMRAFHVVQSINEARVTWDGAASTGFDINIPNTTHQTDLTVTVEGNGTIPDAGSFTPNVAWLGNGENFDYQPDSMLRGVVSGIAGNTDFDITPTSNRGGRAIITATNGGGASTWIVEFHSNGATLVVIAARSGATFADPIASIAAHVGSLRVHTNATAGTNLRWRIDDLLFA